MPNRVSLLKVSRPRFWFYTFGPFLLGMVAAVESLEQIASAGAVILGAYFLFPANLLIYGINDIFDYETDKLNPKKENYEQLVSPELRRPLIWAIAALNIPFLTAALISNLRVAPALGLFLFFSIFYSAPPIRAKTKPFLDSAFNVLYVMPGAAAYSLFTGELPPLLIIAAAGCWTAAMHAYSAIPDIKSDKAAGLKTIATVCGVYGTLALCAVLYLSAAILAADQLGITSVTLGAAYLLLMLASVQSARTGSLFKLYRAFPAVNVAAGFVLFWTIAFSKI